MSTATDLPDGAENPMGESNFEELAKRVDDAVAAVAALEPAGRVAAEELQSALEAVHRAGLVRIVRAMRADDRAREVLFDLVDDPAVRLLLSLHGIIRPDPVTHCGQVLDSVRPQLRSHGGDVSLVRVEDGTAFVRLEGACNGCSMSAATLRNLVEEALVQGVPSIAAVEVVADGPSPTLIPVEALLAGRDRAADGWVKVAPVEEFPADRLVAVSLATESGERVDVLVVNVAQRLSAYRNECAHEALPLNDAVLDPSNGTLTCPWHGFCYDAGSGECLSIPGAQLEGFPLRIDDGIVWVHAGR